MTPHVKKLLGSALHEPVQDFKHRQGKRIRSSLLQLSYELAGGRGAIPLSVSDAVESLHAGSLIIDDIQDDSRSRRGQSTLHQQIGVPLAINAGNWIYFQALERLSDSPLPLAVRSGLLAAMIQTAKQCHEGQAIDLSARVDQVPVEHWSETTMAISLHKTGALVELAVRMGCIVADAPVPLLSVMPAIGRRIGIALQMRNDLDELAAFAENPFVESDDSSLRDDDLRNARLTWPWAWASERTGKLQCQEWALQLNRSTLDRHQVARSLFDLVGPHGDRVISGLISEQIRLLAEHVIDRNLLDSLGEVLQAIACPRITASYCHGDLAKSSSGIAG